MTKQSSRKRIYMLMAGVLPIAIALIMMLGQPVMAQSSVQNDPITKDEYFKNAIIHHKTDDGSVMVKSYSELTNDVKDLLPPPPPVPPTPLGDKGNRVMQPLEKGTLVHLGLDGTVRIKSRSTSKGHDSTRSNPSAKDQTAMSSFMRNDGVRIPYSFSPNGDNKNDQLKPQIPQAGVKSYTLTIYSPSGAIAFHSEDPTESWDGKSKQSNDSPKSGLYVYSLYYIDSNDLEWDKNGQIQLIMNPEQDSNEKQISGTIRHPSIPPSEPFTIVKKENWEEMKVGVVKYYLSGRDTTEEVVKEILDDTDNSFNFAFIKFCEKEGTVIKVIPTKESGIRSSGVDLKVIDDNNVTYYLDGKNTTEEVIEKMNDSDIERLDVHKEDNGTEIRVISKKNSNTQKSKISLTSQTPVNLNGMSWRKDGAMQFNGKTLRDLSIDGAEIYLNGVLLSPEAVLALKEQTTYSSSKIHSRDNEMIIVELEN